jgi:uncharacterized Tic20 family protein
VPTAQPLSKDERTWGMLCHLAALAGCVPIPGASVLGPLIVWLIKREESPFVDANGKEAVNFQITMLIGFVICIPLFFIFIGFILAPILGLVDLILMILAAIKANEGVAYKYPFAIRLIK